MDPDGTRPRPEWHDMSMFHLNPMTLLLLAVLALFIFGPDRLPKAVAEAMRTLRRIRGSVRGATEGFREDLGPEFKDLRLRDLHPRTLIQKHLLDDEPAASDSQGAPPPAPRPAPEGWPEHVPFPSGAEMGLGPDEDPLTTPIPRGEDMRPQSAAVLAQTREPFGDAADAEPESPAAHGNVGRD